MIRLSLILIAISVVGCGSNGAARSTVSTSFKLSNEVTSFSSVIRSTHNAVGVSSTGLTSLKYFITEIDVCQTMSTTGTAFSNPTGCISLYSNHSMPDFESATPNYTSECDLARSTSIGYVDLLDDVARDELTSNTILPAAAAGSYNWGYITWGHCFKFTASIPNVADGTPLLFSHDGGAGSTSLVNGFPVTTAADLTAAPASEAVVALPNGGTWFRFQHPFVIQQSDLNAGTNFKLDLAFDPDGLATAYDHNTPATNNPPLVDAQNNSIRVPLLDLSPIPRLATDSTVVETYTAPINSGTDHFNLRIEIYSLKSDSARTIYGITTRTLPITTTTGPIPDFGRVSFVVADSTDPLAIDFEDWSQAPILKGFRRGSNVGDTTIVSIPCAGTAPSIGFNPQGCASGSSLTNVGFTLTNLAVLK